ncbi:MAG: large adhesin, partial [uncultured bacterium (gcode 4)]
WGIIWNQWTIWDSAYKMLQKNLSKKVVDPLKWSEYDYSLASNKREYQVAWNFENPTSFDRNYNPFDSSVLSPKLSALGWTGANVYISWNYNWVLLKVFTWSTYYFVPTPTLFWLNSWTWDVVYDNTFWSWKDLLPWVNNVAVFDSSKVYASTSSTWLSAAEVANLMTTIQAAYSTWNVTTPAVQEVLSATWSALTDLWVWLVKNSLWGGTSWNIYGWSGNTASTADQYTLYLLHFDWSSINSWTDTWAVSNNWVTFSSPWKFWNAAYFNNAYMTIPDSNNINFWTWDYTIDFWYNMTTSKNTVFISQWTHLSDDRSFTIAADTLSIYSGIDYNWSTTIENISSLPSLNAWHHVASVRNWGWIYLFIDWVLKDSKNIWTSAIINNSTNPIYIWNLMSNNAFNLSWYIDELRISKWIARWTNDFTPPTSAY